MNLKPLKNPLTIFTLYAKLREEFYQIIAQANAERGAGWVREFSAEYPQASQLIEAALQGTPQEVIIKLKPYCDVSNIKGADVTIGKIQELLKREISKPRKSLGPRR